MLPVQLSDHYRNSENIIVDYVWIDGTEPTPHVRSKNRVIKFKFSGPNSELIVPDWGYDGSSTNQAKGNNSDLVLKPVRAYHNPFYKTGMGLLVMCEVCTLDGKPHATNHRSELKKIVADFPLEKPWFGFEQEYTFEKNGRPFGWPERPDHFPKPQAKFYCGVGADEVSGRRIVDKHLINCLTAGISIFGTNAEVMLGQWEFQIGPDTSDTDLPGDVAVQQADDLWMARYILYRTGEDFGVSATLDVKPVPGDWNGAGCHTNFSTASMRAGAVDYKEIIEKLSLVHNEHIAVYGADLDKRLTGLHETCNINTFKFGESDRTASIRVPPSMAQTGKGYLEDRRPGANCDPYAVAARILKTILG